jgi:hypothetical protein
MGEVIALDAWWTDGRVEWVGVGSYELREASERVGQMIERNVCSKDRCVDVLFM